MKNAGTTARIVGRNGWLLAPGAPNCGVKSPRRSTGTVSYRPDREHEHRLDLGRTPDFGNGCLSGARP